MWCCGAKGARVVFSVGVVLKVLVYPVSNEKSLLCLSLRS